VLEQLDLPRERRLGHVQQHGGAAEVQLGCHGHEAAQLRDLEHDSVLGWRHRLFELDTARGRF
jgi:hypothetical protein